MNKLGTEFRISSVFLLVKSLMANYYVDYHIRKWKYATNIKYIWMSLAMVGTFICCKLSNMLGASFDGTRTQIQCTGPSSDLVREKEERRKDDFVLNKWVFGLESKETRMRFQCVPISVINCILVLIVRRQRFIWCLSDKLQENNLMTFSILCKTWLLAVSENSSKFLKN